MNRDKIHDKDEFMNMAREKFYRNFHGYNPETIAQIEGSFLELADYITSVFRPMEDALSVLDKTLDDLIAYCRSLGSSLANFVPGEWLYASCWDKTIEKSFLKYEKKLIAYTRNRLRHPHMAEDVVQDTFTKLHSLGRGEIRKDIEHWLYTACRNRAFDINRKHSRCVPLDPEYAGSAEEISHAPDAAAIISDDYRVMTRFLEESLNHTQLQLLKLKYEKQMSSREIAKALNLSENYVRKALCITLFSVRKKLDEKQ